MAQHHDKSSDPISYLASPQVGHVLCTAFSQLYQIKPQFPVTYLSNWLKAYSKGQATKHKLESTKEEKEKRVQQLFHQHQKAIELRYLEAKHKVEQQRVREDEIDEQIEKTKHLGDLLIEFLPQAIESNSKLTDDQLTGCYIGELTYRRKKLEQNNFEPNAELDVESGKIIEYIGASKSQKFMIGNILPPEQGRSYEAFTIPDEEPPAEEAGEQGGEAKPKQPIKKYIYVPQTQRDQKMFYFKYPRLGSYACFPLKIKSCLTIEAFDKGIVDYKAFVKNKEQIEKQFNERLAEVRNAFEEAKRKFQEFEVNQEEPASVSEKSALQEEYKKSEAAFQEVQRSPPIIEPFKYQTVAKDYFLAVDTLGKDKGISQNTLNALQKRIKSFKIEWQKKEYKMLLDDILAYLQDESTIDAGVLAFQQQEKSIIGSHQTQIKQQFQRQKEAEYELSLIKCSKLLKVLHEGQLHHSLNVYLSYNIPKFTNIVQIVLMLVGQEKNQINLSRSNTLDSRKWITKQGIEKIIHKLQKYQLRRDSSEAVHVEYKISKLLQRLQKIDQQALSRYNAWLYALWVVAKSYCWARLHCRDAKNELHEVKTKAKNDRDAQITKYHEDFQKALQTAKTELTQETAASFVEQDWRKTYQQENARPQPLEVEQLKQFLDIE